MRVLDRSILFLIIFFVSLVAVAGQSRTNRIYRPCYPYQPLSATPTRPSQVSISTTGDITLSPCYQGSITFSDPHAAGSESFTWSSLAGLVYVGSSSWSGSAMNIDKLRIGNLSSSGSLEVDRTITAAGTTGNQTINKLAGTVNIAAGAGTAGVTVTNSKATANSIIFAVARTNDATCSVKNVVPAAGSFVIRMDANCTAETSVGFLVTN